MHESISYYFDLSQFNTLRTSKNQKQNERHRVLNRNYQLTQKIYCTQYSGWLPKSVPDGLAMESAKKKGARSI
jgi:hypothetical protein